MVFNDQQGAAGMSRAAKKRAKAKQKRPRTMAIADGKSIIGDNPKDEQNKKPMQVSNDTFGASVIKKKQKFFQKEESTLKENKDNLEDDKKNHAKDQISSSDDSSDEDVIMKDSALADKQGTESVLIFETYLPRDCKSLLDILLQDSDEYGDDMNTNQIQQKRNEYDNGKNKATCKLQLQELSARKRAQCVLEFILQPASISVSTFYKKYWEKQPLCVRCDDDEASVHRKRFHGFLSEQSIYEMVTKHKIYYVRDISITKHEKGKDGRVRVSNLDAKKAGEEAGNGSRTSDAIPNKMNLDLDTTHVRVDPKTVWNQYKKDDCIIRLLCPVQYNSRLHSLASLMELEWGCRVGIDATLQPHQSWFSPPRYDGMEAFHLQLEGCQQYKVYEPMKKDERLPRNSSGDSISIDLLKEVDPVLDVLLKSGDVLYIPRGFIYQSCPFPNKKEEGEIIKKQQKHSLHMTVSTMQQWAWIDLLEMLIPEALSAAATSETSTSLRQGLPVRFLDYMGIMHDSYRDETLPEPLRTKVDQGKGAASSDGDSDEEDELTIAQQVRETKQLQENFRIEAKKRIVRVSKDAIEILDSVCDQMAIRFLSERLPPALTSCEKSSTATAAARTTTKKSSILPNTLCRIVRPGIARLVLEDNGTKAVVYHCADNSLVFHENPLSPLEFELDDAPAIEQLWTTFEPLWICVADLFHDTIEDKIEITQALFDEGILAIRAMEDI